MYSSAIFSGYMEPPDGSKPNLAARQAFIKFVKYQSQISSKMDGYLDFNPKLDE
jgi:hypothetical protein